MTGSCRIDTRIAACVGKILGESSSLVHVISNHIAQIQKAKTTEAEGAYLHAAVSGIGDVLVGEPGKEAGTDIVIDKAPSMDRRGGKEGERQSKSGGAHVDRSKGL